ncbi:tRNA (guanosine(37)-N1)-methyltransferase TrmD, partial [Candidatus Beckwithbacteria bacterium CG_4_10_14_0_2_um_filter_47_25]
MRDWSTDKHKTVDDKPFGGGPGMVLKVDVVDRALRDLPAGHKILLTPQGKPFSQPLAKKLAQQKQLILICGHYEG